MTHSVKLEILDTKNRRLWSFLDVFTILYYFRGAILLLPVMLIIMYVTRKSKLIGSIMFDNEKIIATEGEIEHIIDCYKIKNIKLKGHNIKGHSVFYLDLYKGRNNWITIYDIDNVKYEYHVRFYNELQPKILKRKIEEITNKYCKSVSSANEFKISKQTGRWIYIRWFFVSFWIVLLTLPFFVPFRVVIFMLLGYIIFGVVFWQKEKKKEKDLITFGDTKIIIESKTICTIDYKDIKKISLSFRSTTSKNWFSLRLIFRPPNFGDSNTLKIEKKDSQVIKKDIWCEVDADYWRLKRIGKFLKEKGVDVKMKGFFRHYK